MVLFHANFFTCASFSSRQAIANSCILWFRWTLFAEFIVAKLKMYEHHPDNPRRKTVEAASKNKNSKTTAKTPAQKTASKDDPLVQLGPLPRFLHHLIVQTWRYLSRGMPGHQHIFLALMVCHAVKHALLGEAAQKGPTGVPKDDHTIFNALFPVSKEEFKKLIGCFGQRSAVDLIQATAVVLEHRIFRATTQLPSVPDAHIHVLASAGGFLIGNRATPLNLQEAVRAAQQDPLQSGVPPNVTKLHPWMTLHAWRALTSLERDFPRFKGIKAEIMKESSVSVWEELVTTVDVHVVVTLPACLLSRPRRLFSQSQTCS